MNIYLFLCQSESQDSSINNSTGVQNFIIAPNSVIIGTGNTILYNLFGCNESSKITKSPGLDRINIELIAGTPYSKLSAFENLINSNSLKIRKCISRKLE